ncbi:MAG TPA: isocitrate lyase/phosphoenolpyruvate mutase family protein [Aliidongia sp.]|nr:isocitrate lyase/phosphoenolpyruvate mutase family protein [Aliidongia sp.]
MYGEDLGMAMAGRAPSKADRFRALHRPGEPLLLVNGWDAASIRAIAAAGLPAAATSSYAMAASLGFADGETVPKELVIGLAGRIASAIEVPLTVDIEAGYGESPTMAAETVGALLRAGVVGINVEDGLVGGVRRLADPSAHGEKLEAIRDRAWEMSVPLFVNARIDTYMLDEIEAGDRLNETVRRAERYLEAGADGIFVPGLVQPEEIAALVKAVPAPVNVMATAQSLPLRQLAALGVARVSLGAWPHLAMLGRLRQAAGEIAEGFDLTPLA